MLIRYQGHYSKNLDRKITYSEGRVVVNHFRGVHQCWISGKIQTRSERVFGRASLAVFIEGENKSLYHPLGEVWPGVRSDRNQTGQPFSFKRLTRDILWQVKDNCFFKLILAYNLCYSLFINIKENIFTRNIKRRSELSYLSLRSTHCKSEIETELCWVKRRRYLSAAARYSNDTIPSKWIWKQTLQCPCVEQHWPCAQWLLHERVWFDTRKRGLGSKSFCKVLIQMHSTDSH